MDGLIRDKINLKPSELAGDSGSWAGVTHLRLKQGTPCRIWIIRVVGKLIVFLHLTGLARCRSPSPPTGVTIELIPCGKLPIPTFPNQGKEPSVGFLLTWEGNLQDTLPNSGRARVGSNYYFVIPNCGPESHSWTNCKGLNKF